MRYKPFFIGEMLLMFIINLSIYDIYVFMYIYVMCVFIYIYIYIIMSLELFVKFIIPGMLFRSDSKVTFTSNVFLSNCR